MKPHPSSIFPRILCFVFFALMLVISCSKDNDVFEKTVLDASGTDVEETVKEEEEEESDIVTEETIEEEQPIAVMTELVYETRTTIFPAIHDAHLQGGIGFNQNIVRLQEGFRTSYLMFDLSPIDSIGGSVTTTDLEFTIDTDNGDGSISIFKAISNDWTEEKLSAKSAPETEFLMGELDTRYDVGQTLEVALDTAFVKNEMLTLVMTHEQGNDLAFASKEHPNGKGPALVVTYSAPQDAEAIFFEDEVEIQLQADVATEEGATESVTEEIADEESASEEETVDEETTEDGATEEEFAEQETTEDGATEEESAEQETTEDGATEEESAEQETTKDGASEEETGDEETTEDGATEEESAEQETTEDGATEEETAVEETTEDSATEEETAVEESAEEIATEENTSDDETTEDSSTEEENTEESEEKSQDEESTLEGTTNEETQEESTEIQTNNEADAPVNESPIAVSEASPTSGDAPLEVSFKGSSSTDDLGVKQYHWDFRDGSTSAEANPTHTFEKTGTLAVRLTVTDNQGASHTDTVTITINEKEENKAPDAVVSASPTSGEAALEVQFNGSNSNDDVKVEKYFWDFKDGSTATSSNPSHNFSKAGTYNVALSVTDEEGLTDRETVTITVTEKENKAPTAVASGSPLTGDAPLEVQFKSSDSNDDTEITGYFWDFKDGSTTTNKNPSHTFSEPGEYDVELSVKDAEGLTDATTVKVTVNQRPVDIVGGDTNDGGDDTSGSDGGDTNNGGNDSSGSDGGESSSGSSGNYPSGAVFASSFGFKSGDATAAFEAAINSGKSYVVIDKQSSDWIIRPTRFYDLQNMTIVFEPGVILRAKAGAFQEGARLFKLTRARNVTIEGAGATFKMNKSEYTSGEQRHAFEMDMCNGVTVRGLTLRDSGGAGMKIMGDGTSGYSQNITLENIRCLNNRRDGITISSAQDVWVRNSEFSGSSGTRPESGVVLESDHENERLVNINFSNCTFSDNESAGVHFSTNKMNGGSRPVSVKFVDSEFSNNAISPPSGFLPVEVEVGGGRGTNVVGGEILFERIKFNGSRGGIVFTRKSANGFKAVFKDCEARNVVTGNAVSPVRLEAHSDRGTLGGMVFDNFYIQYNRDVPFMKIQAPSKSGTFNVKDIRGSFTIQEPGDNPLQYSGGYDASKNQNVSIDYNHH